MISFDEALGLVLPTATPIAKEEVPLTRANDRVLAEAVRAQVNAPLTDVSTMDGYAVCDADLTALPARLSVVGEVFPGAGVAIPLPPASCMRIFTGAPVPRDADRIVMQEQVQRDGGAALFTVAPGSDRHIRKAASDFARGDVLLERGTRLGPRQLVAAAAADVAAVTVWRRPRLIILATGDELAEPGTAASRLGAIPDSISIGLAALGEEYGAEFIGSVRLADAMDELELAARRALREADLIVVTGGASVGERDFAKQMFDDEALDLIFSKVAIKPGKPAWLGRAAQRIILGLPGNPTSAMVTARLFLAPLLAGMTGCDPRSALRWRKAPLATPIGATGDRETFARARLDGECVRIAANQDSGAQKTLAECDVLVRLKPATPALGQGEQVDILDFP